MNRLRNKGGAKADSFYLLENCYVTSSQSIVPRPGTVGDANLNSYTRGLMAFRGKLYVFASEPVVIANPLYEVLVLQHPDSDSTALLKEIHFAQPFLGFPYVVAEFDDDPDAFYHYWLQDTEAWQANHVYTEGAMVEPTSPNGYVYRATRLTPAAPLWGPLEPRAVDDVVEPTEANGYQYKVIETLGDNPASGAVEPKWIAEDGALVYEDVDASAPPTSPPPSTPRPPQDVIDRYGGGNQKGPNHVNTVLE